MSVKSLVRCRSKTGAMPREALVVQQSFCTTYCKGLPSVGLCFFKSELEACLVKALVEG